MNQRLWVYSRLTLKNDKDNYAHSRDLLVDPCKTESALAEEVDYLRRAYSLTLSENVELNVGEKRRRASYRGDGFTLTHEFYGYRRYGELFEVLYFYQGHCFHRQYTPQPKTSIRAIAQVVHLYLSAHLRIVKYAQSRANCKGMLQRITAFLQLGFPEYRRPADFYDTSYYYIFAETGIEIRCPHTDAKRRYIDV